MTYQSAVLETGYKVRTSDRSVEDSLVQRACTGDNGAFGQLYGRFVDRIYRYVYFRISDESTAEDLTSVVFLKAWEHLPKYQTSNKPFIAWLYTIAHNAVIDHYRTHRQTAPLDEVAGLRAPGALPDEQCEIHMAGQALREALLKLTQPQREAITMKLIDGMTTEEIAVRVHKSAGAVRALQMRALQSLASIIADD